MKKIKMKLIKKNIDKEILYLFIKYIYSVHKEVINILLIIFMSGILAYIISSILMLLLHDPGKVMAIIIIPTIIISILINMIIDAIYKFKDKEELK